VLGRSSKPWAAIEIFAARCGQADPSPELLRRLEQLPTFELCFAPGLLWALAARRGRAGQGNSSGASPGLQFAETPLCR
jgi:hypothetical protein